MFVGRTGLIQQGRYRKEQEFLYEEIYFLAHASAKFMTIATLLFCKNIAFPAESEYSYFSVDFRMKIFL